VKTETEPSIPYPYTHTHTYHQVERRTLIACSTHTHMRSSYYQAEATFPPLNPDPKRTS